jgi:hypothetical protein
MKPTDYLDAHPVFRFEESRAEHPVSGRSPHTSATILRYIREPAR